MREPLVLGVNPFFTLEFLSRAPLQHARRKDPDDSPLKVSHERNPWSYVSNVGIVLARFFEQSFSVWRGEWACLSRQGAE